MRSLTDHGNGGTFNPDYAVPAGATLRDVLQELGMTQADLAARTDLSLKHVNQIVHGAAPVTAQTALALEKVTGVPSRIWNRLETNYRDRLARLSAEAEEADLAWLKSLPLKELQSRGLMSKELRGGARVDAVCRFFQVANRQSWERVWRAPLAAFRQSQAFTADAGAVATWLRLGEIEAAAIDCAPYDAKTFRAALRRIRELTDKPDFAGKMVELCAASGVAVVFVREIPKSRASGAARWLTPTKALIQLSLRYRSDDHFWFSFFHEAGHLLLHSKKSTFITGDKTIDHLAEYEANEFSATLLIPKKFDTELRSLRTGTEIKAFATRIGIAPGIVVGRLQREGALDWGIPENKLKRRVDFADE